jgi:hypothetical protein
MLTKCETPWRKPLARLIAECVADGKSAKDTTQLVDAFMEMWVLRALAMWDRTELTEAERNTVAAKFVYATQQGED